ASLCPHRPRWDSAGADVRAGPRQPAESLDAREGRRGAQRELPASPPLPRRQSPDQAGQRRQAALRSPQRLGAHAPAGRRRPGLLHPDQLAGARRGVGPGVGRLRRRDQTMTKKIDPQDKNLKELFQDFYRVPDYQREYVWGETDPKGEGGEEVDQFLNDIHIEFQNATKDDAPEYFIGTI